MQASQVKRSKELEEENRLLEHMPAELTGPTGDSASGSVVGGPWRVPQIHLDNGPGSVGEMVAELAGQHKVRLESIRPCKSTPNSRVGRLHRRG